MRGKPLLRGMDRRLGVPLLAIGSVFRRRRALPAAFARIGLLKTGAVGDMVLLSALAADLRRSFPEAELIMFSGQDNSGAAALMSDLNRHVPLPLANPLKAVQILRRHELEVLLDFGAWPRIDALLSAASGARCTVGFRTKGEHRHFCYDIAVPHSRELHELDNYRRLASILGLRTEAQPRLQSQAVLQEGVVPADPYVVLHLFAGGYRSRLREWDEECWRTLARELSGRGYAIVLTGTPGEAPRAAAFERSLVPFSGKIVDLAGQLSLAEALDVCSRSDCVVSVNTGLMHLAAAAGAPTIALNGPTAEHRWGPVGPKTVSVNSRLPGCGFLNLGGEYEDQREDCMKGISVEDVLEAFDRLVGRPPGEGSTRAVPVLPDS